MFELLSRRLSIACSKKMLERCVNVISSMCFTFESNMRKAVSVCQAGCGAKKSRLAKDLPKDLPKDLCPKTTTKGKQFFFSWNSKAVLSPHPLLTPILRSASIIRLTDHYK